MGPVLATKTESEHSRKSSEAFQDRTMIDILRFVEPATPIDFDRNGDPPDSRFGDLVVISPKDVLPLAKNDIVLLSFPQDEGVRENGGRIGAATAPNEIRSHLYQFTIPKILRQLPSSQVHIKDLGFIPTCSDLSTVQSRLGEVVSHVLQAGAFPIILGGGHETAFGEFLGYAYAGLAVGVVNIDAHLDVRKTHGDLGHSGSPFRQMIEHKSKSWVNGGYICIGVQPGRNTVESFNFVKKNKGNWVEWDTVTTSVYKERMKEFYDRIRKHQARVMLTIDLDAIRQSEAPGVSAPSTIGLSSVQVLDLMRTVLQAGVGSVDIVECNPRVDRDKQTTALAATLIYETVLTLAKQVSGV